MVKGFAQIFAPVDYSWRTPQRNVKQPALLGMQNPPLDIALLDAMVLQKHMDILESVITHASIQLLTDTLITQQVCVFRHVQPLQPSSQILFSGHVCISALTDYSLRTPQEHVQAHAL